MERVKREPAAPSFQSRQTLSSGKRGRGQVRGGGGFGPAAAAHPLRRLPKPHPQLILTVLLDRIRATTGHFGIVSDLSNNIYSTKKLEDFRVPWSQLISMADVDQTILQEDDGLVKVTIAPTGLQIDTGEMQSQLDNRGTWSGFEMDPSRKTTLEPVYNAIVKSLPTYR